MKKISIILVVAFVTVLTFGLSAAGTKTDAIYALVNEVVEGAFSGSMRDHKIICQVSNEYICTFQGGYVNASKQDEKIILKNSVFGDTEYFINPAGVGSFTEKKETITYVNRVETRKNVALISPHYLIPGVTCVPMAGMSLLGFYDLFYDELIPKFTAGTIMYGQYYYYLADNNVTTAAIQLAKDMGANNPATDGVTVSKFKSGMQTYCQRANVSTSFSSCMSNGQLNFNTVKKYLDGFTPIIIFMREFNITSISSSNNTDIIHSYISSSTHAMAVFGYTEITYTLSNGQTQTDYYLQASTGADIMQSALVNINSDIIIDDAYAVIIS